jgi:CRP-like cAMP-binding protein
MPIKELTHEVMDAFSKKNQKKMRKTNDKILAELMLSFSKPMFRLAVISYVLSKILAKPRFYGRAYKEALERVAQVLAHMERSFGNPEEYNVGADNLAETIGQMESEDQRFVKSLMEKGKLKTAAILYAQGMSLSLAAEETGISKQDIMDYSGKTMMADRVADAIGISERVKRAKKFFGG